MTTTDRFTLKRQLDALEADLPRLRAEYPDPADFIMAFAGEADLIQDAAGPDDFAWVADRLQTMAGEEPGLYRLTLGAFRCANCGYEAPVEAWPLMTGEPHPDFHFVHYRRDVPAGSWVCPECQAGNLNVHLDSLGPHTMGPYAVEVLLRARNTEHGGYLYPEAVVRRADSGAIVIHAEVPVGQFDCYEPEPTIERALKEAGEWVARLPAEG